MALRHALIGSILTLGLLPLATGCGGEKPKPKNSGDWLDTLEKKKVDGPDPDIDVDDDDDEPKPEKKAEEKPKPPEIRKSSGRPMIQMGPSNEIKSTFGATPGSILKLKAEGGAITLRIPEFSLDAGYNITFSVDTKGKVKKGAVVGTIAKLILQPGDKLRARAVPTRDKNYEVRLPLGDRVSLNLAVGAVKTDKQGVEQGAPTWKIYAPAKVETAFKEAYFSLPEIGPVMYLHATTEEPTEPAGG